ncbi:MAG: hypothetical protein PHN88_09215 [Ignavibacteria bacterium]|nr:hypothetical protein [Ignavibacteria bacterium]
MFEDIKITVQGWEWDSQKIENDFYKISFFNPSDAEPLTDEIDITPYIIKDSISELTFSLEDFFSGTTNEKFFRASDFSFTVSDFLQIDDSNAAEPMAVRDWFFLVPNGEFSGDTTYIKYLVKLYYKNKLTWMGNIPPEMFDEEINNSDSSGYQIKITAVGLEKEFEDYFTNIKLIDFRDDPKNVDLWIGNTNYAIPYGSGQQYPVRWQQLDIILNKMFVTAGGVTTGINLNPVNPNKLLDNARWILFRDRHFFKYAINEPTYNPRPHFRLKNVTCSFDEACANGDSCYDWFRKICNSMGWIFHFQFLESGTSKMMKLVIKNRYDTTSTNPENYINVNRNNLLNPYTLRKKANRINYPFIALKNGGWTAANSLVNINGSRIFIISNDSRIPIWTDWFDNIAFEGRGFPTMLRYWWDNADWIKLLNSENNEIAFEINKDGVNDVWALDKYMTSNKNVLLIDGGVSSSKMRLNIYNRCNDGSDGSTPSNSQLDYSGNYGNMLAWTYNYQRSMGEDWDLVYCYCDYVKGINMYNQYPGADSMFVKNLRALLKTKYNVATDCSINQIETDILKTVHFEEDNDIYKNENFSISEMKIDFINDKTSFSLINVE